MHKFIVKGGNKLSGTVVVSGAKNVVLKAMVAACLTDEEVVIENIPLISDFYVMTEIIRDLGGEVRIEDHVVKIRLKEINNTEIPLDKAAEVRTSSMFLAPLLAREGTAIIPNPGGCRIGARPIDRTIDGLKKMGAVIRYQSRDGYFHAKANRLKGVSYRFDKNTHTGTETLILAAVLASGRTILENAAEEPEVDELIALLNSMGASIRRSRKRTITINGVDKLHGTSYTVKPDRNEIVTFATAAIITEGNVLVKGAEISGLEAFLDVLKNANGGIEAQKDGIRFFYKGNLMPISVTTRPYPGFMTDWLGPWAVLMTKASGLSIVNETVYENRFGYVNELRKMGGKIELYNPKIKNPEDFYNFNWKDNKPEYFHAAKIWGSTTLHNAVLTMADIRAGATLVLAALVAKGESTIFGIDRLDRGYERFDERLRELKADIKRRKA